MNRICVLVPTALLCACGGSDPLFDGFQPTAGTAVMLEPAVCDIGFVGPAAVSGIAFYFSDFAQPCDVVMQTLLCGNKANATSLLGAVLDGDPGAASIGPARPGTYRYLSEPPSSAFQASQMAAARVDGGCAGEAFGQDGGSITISSVTATNVIGSLDVDFENGTNLSHDFDVTICPITFDTCNLFQFYCTESQRVCVP
jgi:hypothetical protein